MPQLSICHWCRLYKLGILISLACILYILFHIFIIKRTHKSCSLLPECQCKVLSWHLALLSIFGLLTGTQLAFHVQGRLALLGKKERTVTFILLHSTKLLWVHSPRKKEKKPEHVIQTDLCKSHKTRESNLSILPGYRTSEYHMYQAAESKEVHHHWLENHWPPGCYLTDEASLALHYKF